MIQLLIAINILLNTNIPTMIRNDMYYINKIRVTRHKKGKKKRRWYV